MSRIKVQNPAEATDEKTKALYSVVQAKLGKVPNMMRVLGNSAASLEAYLQFSGTMGQTLDAKTREQLALIVAEVNGCDYCVSAHSVIGKMVGLTPEAIREARHGRSSDTRTQAILSLARGIAQNRGRVSDAEVQAARAAGVTDAQLVDVVMNVSLNILTNLVNNFAEPEIDFPKAERLVA